MALTGIPYKGGLLPPHGPYRHLLLGQAPNLAGKWPLTSLHSKGRLLAPSLLLQASNIRVPALLTNIRLGWKRRKMKNTPAYCNVELIKALKVFIVQVPGFVCQRQIQKLVDLASFLVPIREYFERTVLLLWPWTEFTKLIMIILWSFFAHWCLIMMVIVTL